MKSAKGYVITIIAAIGFGLQPLFASFAFAQGVGSMLLAFFRVAFMVPIFLVICLFRKISIKITGRQFLKLLVLALTGAVLTTSLLFRSYLYLDTGTSTTLNFTYPVFVLVLGSIFYKEKITLGTGISFALCIAGVLFFCNPAGNFTWGGFFMALGSGLTYGIYVLYMDKSRILEELDFYAYTLWFFLLSALMLLPVAGFMGEFHLLLSWKAYGFSLLFSLEGGIVATVLLQIGVRLIGGVKASILGALEPVASVAAGALFMSEVLTVKSIIGCVLILASTIVLVLWGNKKDTVPESS